MDEKMFMDFIKANEESLGEKMVGMGEEFFKRLLIANRAYKAAFGQIPENPQAPGELQGTILLTKLMSEVVLEPKGE